MIGLFMLNPPARARARSPSWTRRKNPWVSQNGRKKKSSRLTWGGWGSRPGGTRPQKKVAKPVARKVAKKKSAFRFLSWGGRRRPAGWRSESVAHGVAAKIGWTYRKYASDFRRFGAYAARGTTRGKHKGLSITERSLYRYRKLRRTPVRRLEGRREWFKHRATKKRKYVGAMVKAKRRFGMLYNASAYQKFIGRAVKGARGRADVRRRFRAAVKAWKRRSRKNPVLPISYDNKKRRKSRRHRSNSLYRTSSGRFAKRGGRKLRRYSGGGWKSNRKRRRHNSNPLFRAGSGRYAKRGARRLHRIRGGGWHSNRRHRMNGAILPYTAYSNPVQAVLGSFQELANVDLWTRTILPLTAGFVGTHFVALQAVKMIAPAGTQYQGIVKHGARAASAALLSAVAGVVTRDSDMAAKVLAGGLIAVLGGVISDLIGPQFSQATGLGEMSDLADDLTEDLKARIAAGVRKQFADIEDGGDGSVSAFVTTEDLNRAPRLGDFVTSEALRKATVGSNMPGRAGGGPPREPLPTADLGTFQDALADGSLI